MFKFSLSGNYHHDEDKSDERCEKGHIAILGTEAPLKGKYSVGTFNQLNNIQFFV
ncbi:uncharacterized protein KLLA0_E16149g [Kluyveromyces lactis]|uniref:KLLA0E16149p n=1 Tax=Kluyveromyces lactis (strain ATCC 8585 / CBS 2359 / DSM 70799 / NBRC 1267 / NRRL Y-1140 / WM37) TaxID=284590 RepID=B4UN73_KLULA|nr:uncharacterized protein KLLA0_E16149g [Kluyveromyces lactis]CAR56744.1 KLLA0E16149p [Kluyveromyces lactis]|eukprot:XP_002999406.1 uncharacterized protein KLLA0_E16149g [Kluyveromyces lactis]